MIRLYARVLGALAPEARTAILLVVANIALAGAQFAEPMLFGRIIDRLTRAGQTAAWPDVLPLGSAWAAFGLFVIGCAAFVALHADRLSHRRRLGVMAAFFEHVLHLPLSFHNATHSGRLLKVMLEGANGMAGLWLSFFRDHCAALVALGVLMPLSLVVNWRLGSLLVLLVLAFGCLSALVLRKTEGLQGRVEDYQTAFAERAADALGNVSVIQSFTQVEAETRAMRGLIDALLRAQLPVLSWWAVAAVATRAASTLTILAIFALGLALHFRGLATLGAIVAFMGFATLLITRLEQVVAFLNTLFLLAPKLADFFAVLDTEPAVRDKLNVREPGLLRGAVAFDDVSFSYDGVRDAVFHLTFSAVPGEVVALVGATGSGKSTTLGLLHRVFDPRAGRITIDGIDIRDMPLASLRRAIGVVFQEPMLFARSIADNLRVGKPDATDPEIADALRLAQASDFVERQTHGRETAIGERGRALSGGERQRLSIARALLKNPPILILDEATSALDAETETRLQAALAAAVLGRTTFVIAHRLATIRQATRILVFEDGRIVEQGTYAALATSGGVFSRLVQAQTAGVGGQDTPAERVRQASAAAGSGRA